MVVVTDPAALKQLFTGDPTVFLGGEAAAKLLPILGDGSILLADGEQHLRRRRRLLPVLHGEALAAHATWIAELVERECDRWPLGRPVALLPYTRRIAFAVIVRLVLGPMEQPRVEDLQTRLTRMLTGISGFASWYPRPARWFAPRWPWKQLERQRDAVDELLLEEIWEHRYRRSDVVTTSALAVLVDGASDIPTPTAAELCDELRSLLIVGYETTAAALAWAMTELARAPRVVEHLRADRAGGSERYLHAVIEETLRLHAPVVDAVRMLAEPVELNGVPLPAGTIVMAALPLVHRQPALFADPEAFCPQRFCGGRPGGHSYVPFGGGVRRCLGASLAILELRVALTVVLDRFRLRPGRSEPERARLMGTTLIPAAGAKIILERRNATERSQSV